MTTKATISDEGLRSIADGKFGVEDQELIQAIAAEALASRLPHITPHGERHDETGWLIELKGNRPTWWKLREDGDEPRWTDDSLAALRFARKQDAEAYIDDTGWTEAFASEHMWSDPPSARAAHVSGLDPETVAAIVSELLVFRSPLQDSQELIEAAALLDVMAAESINHGYVDASSPHSAYKQGITEAAAYLRSIAGEAPREHREVLLLASFCGGDNPECSPQKPCPVCLGMSNVFTAVIDKDGYKRELAPEWLYIDALSRPSALSTPSPRIVELEARIAELERENQMSMKIIAEGRSRADAAESALSTAEARGRQIVEAAQPLAAIADDYAAAEDDTLQVWRDFDVLGADLSLGKFRRLRAALSPKATKGDGV